MSVPHKAMRPALYDVLESGSGGYVLPPATSETLGGVKIGEGVEVAQDGTISVEGAEPYILPAATASTLGGVKIGEGVEVAQDGTISTDVKPAAIAEINRRVNLLDETLGQHEGWIEIVQNDLETVEGRVTSLESDVTDLEDFQSDAESALTTHSNDISSLTSRTTALESSVTDLESSVSDLEDFQSNAESALTTHANDISSLTSRTTALESSVTDLETTTAGHTTDIESLDGRIDTLESDLSSLFVFREGAIDNVSINAGARQNSVISDIAPEGYIIVAVRNINLQNATTGGSGRDKCFLNSWSTTGGSTALQIAVYNGNDTTAKLRIAVGVLCMKGAL